jgi:hypothetical protein
VYTLYMLQSLYNVQCTLYCWMQHVSYGFTYGWNRMAECRSWLYHW